ECVDDIVESDRRGVDSDRILMRRAPEERSVARERAGQPPPPRLYRVRARPAGNYRRGRIALSCRAIVGNEQAADQLLHGDRCIDPLAGPRHVARERPDLPGVRGPVERLGVELLLDRALALGPRHVRAVDEDRQRLRSDDERALNAARNDATEETAGW